ncbi:hypothetical protein GCM10020331_079830 [Ectobacillus funiculus]
MEDLSASEKRDEKKEFVDVSLSYGYSQNSRGLGVADMAQAILSGSEHRANGNLAYHVFRSNAWLP